MRLFGSRIAPSADRRNRVSPGRRRQGAAVEALEARSLLSLSVQVDYSLDANHFFDDPQRRTVLQAAFTAAVSRYADTFAAIEPSGSNTWKAVLDNPGSGGTVEVDNLTIPANTLVVYVGGRDMSSLGMGGPGGFSSSGTPAWNTLVAGRGQQNVSGTNARDFGPYGGSIAFDSQPDAGWYFGLDGSDAAIGSANDFYSVALHEMTHVLGFGTCDAWTSRMSGSSFTGPAATNEYDGAGNPPLSPDHSHWQSGTSDGGQETAMDPDLTTGERKLFTALDLAAMDDIGYDIALTATLSSASSVTQAGAATTTFNVTYSHYNDIDKGTIGTGDLFVTGPNGFNSPASLESVSGSGKSVVATYSIPAPGGTFDGADSGSYAVMMQSLAVGDAFGNFVPAGSLGSFNVDIDAPPAVSSFSAPTVTQIGAPTTTVTVTYSDTSGVNIASIGPSNITVTRNSDGLALTVLAASPDVNGNGSPRTVTYTVAAPDGTWDPTDNGTYTAAIAADQVRDVSGSAVTAATLGTFDVAIGTVQFTAISPATFTDASGDQVVVSLKGPGSGQLVFMQAGNSDPAGIFLTGTTSASALTITANGGGTTLGGLSVNGDLKSLTAKTTDLAGEATVSGVLPRIQLRSAAGSLAVNGPEGSIAITLAAAKDLSITTGSTIKTLKAGEWLDTDATPDVITAASVGAVTIKGDFQAGISAASLAKLTIGGALSGADIRTTGNIGGVTVGAAATDNIVFAGVRSDLSSLPTAMSDFTNPASSIKSFTLRNKAATFNETRVAAGNIGKASLGVAQISAVTGNQYGLAADRIASVVGATSIDGPYKRSRLSNPEDGFADINFAVIVL
jgi:hypothetical protein